MQGIILITLLLLGLVLINILLQGRKILSIFTKNKDKSFVVIDSFVEEKHINFNYNNDMSNHRSTLMQMWPWSKFIDSDLESISSFLMRVLDLDENLVELLRLAGTCLLIDGKYFAYAVSFKGNTYLTLKQAVIPNGHDDANTLAQMRKDGWSVLIGSDHKLVLSIPPKNVIQALEKSHRHSVV